jgi:dipeptidyl aminopeptidase/acylaminoacyl peptidase
MSHKIKIFLLGVLKMGVILPAALMTTTTAQAATAPNGRIAYVAQGPSTIPFGPTEQKDIWVMNPDGTGAVNLTDTSDVDEFSPVWSPDGSRIAFISNSFTRTLSVMNADGSGRIEIVSGALDPSWGPDGTQIAVMKERDGLSAAVVIVNLSTLTETVVSEHATMEPVWSPDGSKIAFVDVRPETYPDLITNEPIMGSQHEIVVTNVDGSGEVVVSAGEPGSERASYLEEDRAPAWSPDGSKIVFMSQAQNPSCCGAWQIWAMNADGSGISNLTADDAVNDLFPVWSPDGTQILFQRPSGAGYDLFTMPAPTSLPIVPIAIAQLAVTPLAVTGAAVALTSSGNAFDANWGAESTVAPMPTLTVTVTGRGQVTSWPTGINCGFDCEEAYDAGTRVTLRATAQRGAIFVGWGGVCTGRRPICTITLKEAKTVTATFKRKEIQWPSSAQNGRMMDMGDQ